MGQPLDATHGGRKRGPVASIARRNRWISLCYPLFFIMLLACGSTTLPAFSETPPRNPLADKNVLILHAFESNVPIFELTDRGIRETLDAGGVSIRNQFFEYLDLGRNPGADYRKLLVEQMRMRYGHRKFDIIITMYKEALEFALNECRDIFSGVPVIGLYLPRDYDQPRTDSPVVRQLIAHDLTGTLEIALHLAPKTQRVYVVTGANPMDKSLEAKARKDFNPWENRLEFRYLGDKPFKEILAEVAGAPDRSIVLLTGFAADVTGRVYTTREVARRLSQVSNAPVFGLHDVALGYGIVGGLLISFEHIGTQAAKLALDILEGLKQPDHIPDVMRTPQVAMFDWRQLRHWNLSEAALPEGSVVINRETTLWDFRYYIFGGLAFILAQSFLITALLIHRRRRRSAEKALWQRSQELDQFFQVSLDLLCIADTGGHFLRLNPVWERVLGHSREELMSKRFLDFVHPDDMKRTRDALAILGSHGEVTHFENRYQCKDGTYRWLEWTSVPAGEVIYAAARDFTERLKAEMEERQRRDELAHLTRIALMGELTTSLAHEINQPLTAILTNAEAGQRFLSGAQPDIQEVRQILEDIIRDNRRAGDVIRRVRALVKKEASRQELLDLNEVVQEIISLIRGDSLLEGLTILTERSPGPVSILGDRTQLQQVMLNLIMNGAAAMRSASPSQRKLILKTEIQDNRTVKVAVTDFGVGIDEKHVERLFEPFYTTKADGLGMGLSISRTIIVNHGGTLNAVNNPEGGTTFFFMLPARQGGAS